MFPNDVSTISQANDVSTISQANDVSTISQVNDVSLMPSRVVAINKFWISIATTCGNEALK